MASLTRKDKKHFGELLYSNLDIRKEIIKRDERVKKKMKELNNLKSATSLEPTLKPVGEQRNTLKLDANKKQVLKDVHKIQKTHNQSIEEVVKEDLVKQEEGLRKLSSRDIHELLDDEIIIDNAHKPNGLYTNKEINDFLEQEGFEPIKDEIKQTKNQEIKQNKMDMLADLDRLYDDLEKDDSSQLQKELDLNKDDIDLDPDR